MSGDTKSGIETLPDGRKIPFSKLFGSGDYVVTFYGSRDATAHSRGVSLLAKHTRRGTTTWGMAYDSFAMLRGEASRVLQKQWGTREANELYLAVERVRRFPEELKDTSTPYTSGSIIQDAVLREPAAHSTFWQGALSRWIRTSPRTSRITSGGARQPRFRRYL